MNFHNTSALLLILLLFCNCRLANKQNKQEEETAYETQILADTLQCEEEESNILPLFSYIPDSFESDQEYTWVNKYSSTSPIQAITIKGKQVSFNGKSHSYEFSWRKMAIKDYFAKAKKAFPEIFEDKEYGHYYEANYNYKRDSVTVLKIVDDETYRLTNKEMLDGYIIRRNKGLIEVPQDKSMQGLTNEAIDAVSVKLPFHLNDYKTMHYGTYDSRQQYNFWHYYFMGKIDESKEKIFEPIKEEYTKKIYKEYLKWSDNFWNKNINVLILHKGEKCNLYLYEIIQTIGEFGSTQTFYALVLMEHQTQKATWVKVLEPERATLTLNKDLLLEILSDTLEGDEKYATSEEWLTAKVERIQLEQDGSHTVLKDTTRVISDKEIDTSDITDTIERYDLHIEGLTNMLDTIMSTPTPYTNNAFFQQANHTPIKTVPKEMEKLLNNLEFWRNVMSDSDYYGFISATKLATDLEEIQLLLIQESADMHCDVDLYTIKGDTIISKIFLIGYDSFYANTFRVEKNGAIKMGQTMNEKYYRVRKKYQIQKDGSIVKI